MMDSSSPIGLERQAERLRQYQKYLNDNYKCGVQRFFSPTGSLAQFQKTVAVSAGHAREVVVATGVEDAALKLEKAVAGCDGVFDLTSEPGSGKTSVLPFKFPSKRVVVALPTPFDAWAAFQMATGDAALKLKGLTLGSGDRVCYTDSYLAANMVLSGFMDYDVLIVDECDSGKGVTAFLGDVKVKGKLVIRMSASHGRTSGGPSKSFNVAEVRDLPDARVDLAGFVGVAKPRFGKRTLVLMPDSESAGEVAGKLPGSTLITAASGLDKLAGCMIDQLSDRVFVADDVCARGLNLNLDVLVDSQLVTEHGVTRHVTKAELYQRKNRVGRNKDGWYVSPGLSPIDLKQSEADVLRSNILRSLAGIQQYGPADRHVPVADAADLLCSDVEPIVTYRFKSELDVARPRLDTSATRRSSVASVRRDSRKSTSSGGSSPKSKEQVSSPSWMSWLVPSSAKEMVGGKSYYVSEVPSYESVPVQAKDRRHKDKEKRRGLSESMRELAVAPEAPYAVVPAKRSQAVARPIDVPAAPPTVDLTQLEYHMDWPAAIRDALLQEGDLPTIVPPHNWRHTSTGGLGTNWFVRLDSIAVSELKFVEEEFEVVCRAWNKMVASAWVKRTPGLSSAGDRDRVEFCARYFQSYFQLLHV